MGICSWCGTTFPKTRATRKYCTSRCKTNACLGRKPSRLRVADVQALHEIVEIDFPSVEALRERLRSILGVDAPPLPLSEDGRPLVPRLD
ncbi:MAG TPA: hypothetical protein VFN10_07440 [Thermoanaerobaculia bacterium]|nr:hypothetical protein [Thermoanaerobaculia bacterium]